MRSMASAQSSSLITYSCPLLSLVAGSRRLEAMVGETEQVFDDGSWLLLGQVMTAVLYLDGVAHVGRDLAPDLRHRLAGQVTPISPQQRHRHRHPHARGALRAVAWHVDLEGGPVVLERGAHRAGLEEGATVLAVRAVGVQPVEKSGCPAEEALQIGVFAPDNELLWQLRHEMEDPVPVSLRRLASRQLVVDILGR